MRKSKRFLKIRKNKKRNKTVKKRYKKNKHGGFMDDNGKDMERYGETNPYSMPDPTNLHQDLQHV
jgi:hypothetical protein